MTRVLLFDWTAGAHNELYLERFAGGVPDHMTAIVASPSATAARMGKRGIEVHDLGDPRPRMDTAHHMQREVNMTARRELDLFREAITRSRPDYAVHMYADGMLRQLVRAPTLPARVSLLLFRPRAHYPASYDTRLPARQRILGAAYELLVRRWRQRVDAHAILTLDEAAADRWGSARGAPAVWVPEPPVSAPARSGQFRRGATLFGSLAPRKGIDRLVAAASIAGDELSLTLAGSVTPGFDQALTSFVTELRAQGVAVELRAAWHNENAAIELLGKARCVVLPYVAHYGMSRVLLEAAHAGTPVVTHDHGMLGHLVTTHGIGIAVNIDSPKDLRQAIDALCHDDQHWETYHRATKPFAQRYSHEAFKASLSRVFR